MVVILGFLVLYLGIAFLAPLLMNVGFESIAKWIYQLYSNTCHQLAFRSWFLFGQQAAYPRDLANVANQMTYEQVFGFQANDFNAARRIIGNEFAGYKVALCQRDIAMYLSMILFGIIFLIKQKKIGAISFWIWLVIGIIPVGWDGVSQLPATGMKLLESLPLRESTPMIRSVTGFFFGFFTGWYLYPTIENSFHELKKGIIK